MSREALHVALVRTEEDRDAVVRARHDQRMQARLHADQSIACLLYTSDAADERSSVDLGGRRIIKKKTM